jgi:hypothetical protein
MPTEKKQRITISLCRITIRKLKMMAQRRGVSISELVVEKLDKLWDEEDSYDRSRRRAMRLLQTGFRIGAVRVDRDSLHERNPRKKD